MRHILFSIVVILFTTSRLNSQSIEIVKDIPETSQAYRYHSYPNNFNKVNGSTLFFTQMCNNCSYNSSQNLELWKTDSTEKGTSIVKNLGRTKYSYYNGSSYGSSSGSGGLATQYTINNSNSMYFIYESRSSSYSRSSRWSSSRTRRTQTNELWITDGTSSGTKIIDSYIHRYDSRSNPRHSGDQFSFLAKTGSKILLATTDLYEILGDSLVLIRDFNNSEGDPVMRLLGEVNNKLIISVHDSIYGKEVWSTDGTVSGTFLLNDIRSGTVSSNPSFWKIENGKLYFYATDGSSNNIWSTDGSISGTTQVTTGSNVTVNDDFEFNGETYYIIRDNVYGTEIWKQDSLGVLSLFKDINIGSVGSDPRFLGIFQDKLIVGANDGTSAELWSIDGVNCSKVSNLGLGNSSIALGIITNNILYFSGYNSLNGTELYVYDGVTADSITGIAPGVASAYPTDFHEINGKVVFIARSVSFGNELYVSDGTNSGTMLLKDIKTGTQTSSPNYLGSTDSLIFYNCHDDLGSYVVYRTDGSASGTLRISPSNIRPKDEFVFNNRLYFLDDRNYGFWSVDGDSSNTVELLTNGSGIKYEALNCDGNVILNKGVDYYILDSNNVIDQNPNQNKLDCLLDTVVEATALVSYNGSTGQELYLKNGNNYTLVKDINKGNNSMSSLSKIKDALIFKNGTSTWSSKGFDKNTQQISNYSLNGNLNNGEYVFGSANIGFGTELSYVDGKVLDTLIDIIPGGGSSNADIGNMSFDSSKFVFRALATDNNYYYWESDGTKSDTTRRIRSDLTSLGFNSITDYIFPLSSGWIMSDNTRKKLYYYNYTGLPTQIATYNNMYFSTAKLLGQKLLFREYSTTNDSKLIVSDGSSAGTLALINSDVNSNPVVVNNSAYVTTQNNATSVRQLYRTNGSIAGTQNIYTSTGELIYVDGSSAGDKVFLNTHNNANSEKKLLTYDPVSHQIDTLNMTLNYSNSFRFQNIVEIDSTYYFMLTDGSTGYLHKYDLRTRTEELVNTNLSNMRDLTLFEDNLYFLGNNSEYGDNLWAVRYKELPILSGVYNETVCFGDSIVYYGTTYDANNLTGTEVFTNIGPYNCDSTVTVTLTVLPDKAGIHNETVCFGGSIVVNGTTYDANNLTGTEVFTNIGPHNCDSTVAVSLTIVPEKTGVHNDTVCYGGSIVVNGTTYDANNLTGTEVFTNIGPHNCDSTVAVSLTIVPEKTGVHNDTVCYGGSIVVNGTTYDANNLTGTEVFTNIGPHNCDSTVAVSLTIVPEKTGVHNDTVCYGGSIVVNGTTYDANNLTGTEVFTNIGPHNCDSTVAVSLTIVPEKTGVHNDTVCYGGSIVVNGTTYDANNLTGTEVFTNIGPHNCDSTVAVSLTIVPEKTGVHNDTVCYGGSIVVNGTTYDANNLTGTEVFTNIGPHNCDSTVAVSLTIVPEKTGVHNETVCYGGSIVVNGTTYDANNLTGTEVFTNIGPHNCDSTVAVSLTIVPEKTGVHNDTVCYGGSIVVNGTTYDANNLTGTEVFTNIGPHNCDSTVAVSLTIVPEKTGVHNDTVCYGGSIVVNGTTYDANNLTGTEVFTNIGPHNCDSTVAVSLTIVPEKTGVHNDTVCYGGSIVVNGTTYDANNLTGTEVFTNIGPHNCDSTVAVSLTIVPEKTGVHNDTVCYGGSIVVNGTTYDANNLTGTEVFTNIGPHNCDSTVAVSLTIVPEKTGIQNDTVCYGGSIVVNGTTYDANNLTGTEVFTNIGPHNCDSTVAVSLTIVPEKTGVHNDTVCYGGSIVVNGTTYDANNLTGTEVFTNIGPHNCDSTVAVSLTIVPEKTGVHNDTVCYGGSIVVNGTTYDANNLTGTEVFTNIGPHNCDSTVAVSLTIVPEKTGVHNDTVCYGGSIVVNGTTYDANNLTGTEVFTNIGPHNCDSTVAVSLTIVPEKTGVHNDTVCYGGSIVVNGTTYDANNLTGTEVFTNIGPHNCDSTVAVSLTIVPEKTGVHNDTVCYGGSIVVNGTTYDANNLTGTEVFTNIGPHNCDSTVAVSLTIVPEKTGVHNDTVCYGGSIVVNGTTYDANNLTGTEVFTNIGPHNCDSTVAVSLTIVPEKTGVHNDTVCYGGSIVVNGTTYDANNLTGTEVFTNIGPHNCDSTVAVSLTIVPEKTGVHNDTVCYGGSIVVNGTTYDANNLTGTEVFTNIGPHNCDSTVAVSLTIVPEKTGVHNDTVCYGGSIVVNGTTYDANNLTGTEVFTNIGPHNCDSTVAVSLTIVPEKTGVHNDTVCYGGSIVVNGTTYDANNLTGTEVFTNIGPHNCDSTVAVSLTIVPEKTGVHNDTVCYGGSIVVNGTTYDANNLTGTEVFTNIGPHNCDSTVAVSLTIVPEKTGVHNDTVCYGGSIVVNGTTYDANNLTGTEVFTNIGPHNCDSTVAVSLTIVPEKTGVHNDTVCYGGSIVVNGTTYDANNLTGTEVFTNIGPHNCDSTVAVSLTIVPEKTGVHNDTVCFGGSIVVNGTTYDANNLTGTEVFTNIGPHNCDSTVAVSLTIVPEKTGVHNDTVCYGGSIVVNGTTYDANNLTGTEVFTNIGPHNCDSTVAVTLTILPSFDLTVTRAISTLTSSQIGANYQWLDCDSGYAIIPFETNQSFTPTVNGNYAVEISFGGCVDTTVCNIVSTVGIGEESALNFSVYPNPSRDNVTIKLANLRDVEISIISITGVEVFNISNLKESQINISLNGFSKGVYFIRVQSGNKQKIAKLIKQ